MRKIAAVLLCIQMLLLYGCVYAPTDPVVDSLPAYREKVMYTEGSFQDYTDYGKMTYDVFDKAFLEDSDYFEKVSAGVENVLSYIENFEGWVRVFAEGSDPSELTENYDFDKTMIDENDYVYIKTKEDAVTGDDLNKKFDNYTVYFFDVDTNTLFYFHNNI